MSHEHALRRLGRSSGSGSVEWDDKHWRPVSDISTTPQDDTCYYTSEYEGTGFFFPRECSACLEKEGCMINQFGQCVDMHIDGYNPWMDFEAAIASKMSGPGFTNPRANTTFQQYHFPAKRRAYCDRSDPVCVLCRQTAFLGTHALDTRFCVGANGCLCIAACELQDWTLVVAGGLNNGSMRVPRLPGYIMASSSSSSDGGFDVVPNWQSRFSTHDFTFQSQPIAPSIFASALVFVMCVVTALLYRRHALKLFRQYEDQGVVAVSSIGGHLALVPVPSLDLFGWRAHIEELREKEDMLLAGCSNLSPVRHRVEFFVSSPTAPTHLEGFPEGSAPCSSDAFVNAMAPTLSPYAFASNEPDFEPSAPYFDELDDEDIAGEYTIL